MAKIILFLLGVAIAIPLAKLDSRSLVDEIDQQLFELKNIVYGEIGVARNRLIEYDRDFKDDTLKVKAKGKLEIEQNHENVNGQLTSIKELALATGTDITSCTDNNEVSLTTLQDSYIDKMNVCIGGISDEASKAIDSARYVIDIVITKVHNIEFQLGQCKEDLLCMEPILTQILLHRVDLPQDIKSDLASTKTLLDNLRISVQSCSDVAVSEYVSDSYFILEEIQTCVDSLIA